MYMFKKFGAFLFAVTLSAADSSVITIYEAQSHPRRLMISWQKVGDNFLSVSCCPHTVKQPQQDPFVLSTRPLSLLLHTFFFFFLLSVFTPKFWVKNTDVKVKAVNCTETASLLPPVALILSFPSCPPEAVLSVPLWCLRQACESAAAATAVKNHETVTDDSLSTRCLNRGQSAFSLLSRSPDTHTQNN